MNPLLLLIIYLLLNNGIDNVVNKLNEYNKPKFREVEFWQSDSTVSFLKDEYKIEIKTDPFDDAIVSIKTKDSEIEKFFSNYQIWGHYLSEIKRFDLDNNGLDDILIISYPVGASGLSANIQLLTCLLFFPNNVVKYYEFSSFFNAENLFFDFDKDNKFEFVSINYSSYENNNYFVFNAFCYENFDFENCSQKALHFPILLRKEDDNYIEVTSFPEKLLSRFQFSKPNVWK